MQTSPKECVNNNCKNIFYVPKEHLQLCENIQNSSHTFGNTLEKTYTEKNKVLAKEMERNTK